MNLTKGLRKLRDAETEKLIHLTNRK